MRHESTMRFAVYADCPLIFLEDGILTISRTKSIRYAGTDRSVVDRKLGQFAGPTATALKYIARAAEIKREEKKQTACATHGRQKYRVDLSFIPPV